MRCNGTRDLHVSALCLLQRSGLDLAHRRRPLLTLFCIFVQDGSAGDAEEMRRRLDRARGRQDGTKVTGPQHCGLVRRVETEVRRECIGHREPARGRSGLGWINGVIVEVDEEPYRAPDGAI